MRFIPFGKRKNPRRVRGFLCDKGLWIAQWVLTQQLGVPLYCTVEHSLQLGGAAIAKILFDEKAKKKLVDHLTQEHLLKPLLDPDTPRVRARLDPAGNPAVRLGSGPALHRQRSADIFHRHRPRACIRLHILLHLANADVARPRLEIYRPGNIHD